MRRLAGLIVLAALLAIVATAGCAKRKIVAVENLPPETTLFVQGSLDTVNHVVRLFWFGSDPDGEIVGYEFMIDNPAQPESAHWVFTNRTDSLFTIHAPAGYAMPTFRVRAIDNSPTPRPSDAPVNAPAGQRDPSPAIQDFQFSNQAPTVRFTQRLIPTDTTYASVTLAWTATDPDGNDQALRFQVGLDTVPAALHLVAGNGVTLDTTDFKVAGEYPTTRPRQAFIRAIDDGGRTSAWDSVRWVVRAPASVHPNLLLIDDVPGATGPLDNPYWLAARNLPAGSVSILRLEFTQPFRSVKDLAQTFRLFDAVIWYRGTQGQTGFFSTVMRDYQDGMAAYLDGGGKLMIESLNLIEGHRAIGALRPDWVTRYMGSTDLIYAPLAGEADTSASWSIAPGHTIVDTIPDPDVTYTFRSDLRSTILDDSLRNNINTNGLRGFAVIDTLNHVALWARDSTLSPLVDRDIPIAVTVPVPGTVSGRLVVFTTPLGGANGFGNVNRFLCKVFQHMGLGVCP